MIYLVTAQTELFSNDLYTVTNDVQASIELFKDDWRIQVDSETTGLTPQGKICDFICFQIGNDTDQIVIDTSTIDIRLYKELLESKLLVLANGKFDLMFLYNYDIHPLSIFDVMITEQVLHLGYPNNFIGVPEEYIIKYMEVVANEPRWEFMKDKEKAALTQALIPEVVDYMRQHSGCSLKALAYRYLGVDMDKTVRGKINYLGLSDEVILYSATDVKLLNKIMDKQLEKLKEKGITNYCRIENQFVPVCAYGEWCGIYLNPRRWGIKMYHNQKHYAKALKELDDWFIKESETNLDLLDFVYVGKPGHKKKVKLIDRNLQGDLFTGWDTEPRRTFEWSQGDYVIEVARILGFDVSTIDKKKGEEKDSIEEDVLKNQKGINDEFLKYYFALQGWNKEITGYGQNYLDAINPITGRLHPVWKQIGTKSARMTNGSEVQKDLMRIKKLGREIKSMNVQVLPKSFMCRESFTPQDQHNGLLAACDYSACEARLGAMIYNDDMMLQTFDNGWDSHSVAAKLCFPNILKDVDVNRIKKEYPHLRQNAKAPEFACQFGGSAKAIAQQLGCSDEEAEQIYTNYMSGYKGMKDFQTNNGRIALSKGYVPCTKHTGGKIFWWDYAFWKKERDYFSEPGFWDHYRSVKANNPHDPLVNRVRLHMKAKSAWSQRNSLNFPTQHSGAEIFKRAMRLLYEWIIENGYFNKVKICAFIHDECVVEYDKSIKETPRMIEKLMEQAAYEFHTRLPIPAEAAVCGHWVH